MARPKRVRVSKRARRRAAGEIRSCLTITTASSATSLTVTSTTWYRPRQIVIESLDEGVTWHTTDTVEPAANVNGELMIGVTPWGVAPECMRPGSGTYRFEVTLRQATADEAAAWVAARPPTPEPTAEEIAAEEVRREAERLAEEARQERIRLDREKADARARELLLSHISKSQRRDLIERGGFWVLSQFRNRYWVTPRTAVRFDDRGIALQYYCIYPEGNLPADDNALARLLTLQCDEEAFLRTANAGPPSDFHLMPPQPRPVGNLQVGPNAYINAIGELVQYPVVVQHPILLWANGLVRPLCG